MRITYFHAACQVIEASPDLRVLADPWFGFGDGQGGGNYDGSWGPSIPLPSLPDIIEHIGPVEYIYVSHLHPDHYAPEFLRTYLHVYPTAEILTSTEPMFLAALKRDGFQATQLEPPGIRVLRHPVDAMDSALVVVAGDYAVVHLNDCRFHEGFARQIKALCGSRALTAFLPYCGAGEWPQTYEMAAHEMTAQATRKRRAFQDQFCQWVDVLQPTRAIPIAGESEYIGPLASLNPLRGLATPQEAARWRPQGCVFRYGDRLDLVTGRGIERVVPPWEPAPPPKFLGYRYERDFVGIDPDRLEPLLRGLAQKAAHTLLARQTLAKPYWLAIGTPTRCYAAFDLSGRWGVRPAMDWAEVRKLGEPREEIEADPRALYGVLTGLYNFNTLMGGAHLHCRRTPLSAYEEAIYYSILPRLHV